MKKSNELKELSVQDLRERLDAEKVALNQLVINHSITPLDDSGSIREKRRQVARIYTELRERELKNMQ